MNWRLSFTPHVVVYKALPSLVQAIVDAATPALLADVVTILGRVGVTVPRDQLLAMASRGDVDGLDALLTTAWEAVGQRGLEATILPRLQAVALDAAAQTTVIGVEVAFNRQDSEALATINAVAGRDIVAIGETTREAIRGIVRRAFEAGTPLTQQVAEIAQAVGLTPLQAERVARYRQGLVAAGEPPGRVTALVEQRTQQVRRQRAEAIARTEALNAAHAGQAERLAQAVREGLVDAPRVKRFWVLGPRPCPTICVPIPGMNAQGVGVDEPFQTPVGPLMHPTAHVNCMCVVNTVVA